MSEIFCADTTTVVRSCYVCLWLVCCSPQWAGRRWQQRQRTSHIYRQNRPRCFWSCSAFHHLYWRYTAPGPPPEPDLRHRESTGKKKTNLGLTKTEDKKTKVWQEIRAGGRLCTWEDEEDSRDKSQDGAVWPNVADVAENKTDEHEEKTDQRERSGWADHLWRGEHSEELKLLLNPKIQEAVWYF